MNELSSYDSSLSSNEQDAISVAKSNYDAAEAVGDTAGMAAAHDAAEAVRASHGYSGGITGDSFVSIVKSVSGALTDRTNGSSSTGGGLKVYSSIPSGVQAVASPEINNGGVEGVKANVPTDIYSGNFSGLVSSGEAAGGSTDIPTGLKTMIVIFGGVMALGFVTSIFRRR